MEFRVLGLVVWGSGVLWPGAASRVGGCTSQVCARKGFDHSCMHVLRSCMQMRALCIRMDVYII